MFVAHNGMDVARAAYLDPMGQVVPVSRLRPGRKWLVEDRDTVSSYRYYREGSMTIGEWIRSFRGVEEAAYFAGDDLKPFFYMWYQFFRTIFNRIRRKGWGPCSRKY